MTRWAGDVQCRADVFFCLPHLCSTWPSSCTHAGQGLSLRASALWPAGPGFGVSTMPTTTGLGAALRPRPAESPSNAAAAVLAHCGSSLAISCSTGGCGCRRRGVNGAPGSPLALEAWKQCSSSQVCAHAGTSSQAMHSASLIAAGSARRPPGRRAEVDGRVREERECWTSREAFVLPSKRWRPSSSPPPKPPYRVPAQLKPHGLSACACPRVDPVGPPSAPRLPTATS